jgi:hypothetical protein
LCAVAVAVAVAVTRGGAGWGRMRKLFALLKQTWLNNRTDCCFCFSVGCWLSVRLRWMQHGSDCLNNPACGAVAPPLNACSGDPISSIQRLVTRKLQVINTGVSSLDRPSCFCQEVLLFPTSTPYSERR